MAALELPNVIEIDTTADAVEVEQNYQYIQNYVNASVIRRDGAVSMAAQLQLVGDPEQDRHAASKAYVDKSIPIGVMMPFAGASAPAGGQWLLCNGAQLSTSTYPKLFQVLQFRYGGSGSLFNLPNMAQSVPVGVDSTQERFNATGKKGGSYVVPVPEHKHSIAHDHGSVTSDAGGVAHTHTINHDHGNLSTTTGSGGIHSHIVSARSSSNSTSQSVGGASTTGTTYTIGVNDSVAHTHAVSVNLPSFSGASGAASATSHTHGVNLPSYAGDSANTGTASAELLPPFVVFNYIIRADDQ